MSTVSEKTAVVTRFDDWDQARHFAEELQQAGMPEDEIGILSPRREVARQQLREGALYGALGGLVFGLVAGGLCAWLLPGFSGLLSVGIAGSMLGGALICFLAGALVGALIALAIPPREAGHPEGEEVLDKILVVIETESCPAEVFEVLERHIHSD